MSDIKPKDGEIWMVEGSTRLCPVPIIWRGAGTSPKPLYRLSRHTKLNELEDAQAAGKQLQYKGDNKILSSLGWRIKPEPKPLIIPWDVISDKYIKAVCNGCLIAFTRADGKYCEIVPALLSIDLTGVPNGATAERPAQVIGVDLAKGRDYSVEHVIIPEAGDVRRRK